MVWFGLRQHPSEASVKVSSRSDLVWRFQRRFRVGLVRFGLVVYGLRKHQSKTSGPKNNKCAVNFLDFDFDLKIR